MTGAVCSADVGGTWLRVAVRVPGRRALLRTRIPFRLGDPVERSLARALRRLGLRRVERLVLGARGVWLPREKAALRARLRPLARKALVLSDLELARSAAFGDAPGLLLVAGTGSAAYGRGPGGKVGRFGGLGALLGDEGSAFWMGRAWLRLGPEPAALRAVKKPAPVRAVAARAREVLRRAPRDARARRIVRTACADLAALAESSARALRLRPPVPLAAAGGLFRSPLFAREFRRALAGRSLRFRVLPPGPPPEEAALSLLDSQP
ncbi:MAG: BadF/BadG/BcrA/BcrD ATPase family protein [Elusimicrobiota bacterium]|jgi:glucosamine kinase